MTEYNQNWNSVLDVCLDVASTMSGHISGVQACCKQKNNKIIYVHCYGHCLNLALIDSIFKKNNRIIFDFLETLQFAYTFIESSPSRHAVLEKISNECNQKLKSLSTRWDCRLKLFLLLNLTTIFY